ncbi:hypothetical protein DH2020_000908 [Rehmannia glutinosa]|uniref:Retrotransposon Copia-like N-terminal domain-containing protein n=1 Tax=Rehmannia glutinosa TaxID=99300 RepID=A0ABR0XXX9_REHGL
MESSSPMSIVIYLPHFTPIILRLDRNNYNFWKAQVLSTVRAHGFEGFLFGIVSTPPKYSSPSTSDGSDLCLNPDYVSWVRKDQYLLSWMLSSISESMLGHVNHCSTVVETHEMRLQSQVTTQFSSSALQASVASHDSVLGSHPSANAAYGFSQNYQQGGGGFIRGRGRGGRNGPFRNINNKPKCQLCWKTGHVALKCYKRFDVNFTSPDYAFSGSGNDSSQAHISVFGSSTPVDPNWYFDSGASTHVTTEMDNLSFKSHFIKAQTSL